MTTQSPTLLEIEESEVPSWLSRSAFPILTGVLIVSEILMALALAHHLVWLVAVLTPVIAHLMHGQIIGLHEASHSLLRKKKWLNELDGFILATFSFMSFTLYRASHQTHHMHLSTERDEELWPFVDPAAPRWKRVAAAILELNFGLLYTPFLFFRTFLRKDSPIRAPRIRARIWRELAMVAAIWITVVAVVAPLGLWKYLVFMYVVPAFIAGNLQSWRKYIEHVGMIGNTPNSATRSIVCRTFPGKLVSFTLLHEPYHGVHHEMSGLPHAELPIHSRVLEPKEEDDTPPFPSYKHALLHLIRSLADPRVGGQWRRPA